MTVSEADRLHLFDVARRQLDEGAAATLMNLLPPDPERLATKDDLALTTATLRTEMAELRADVRTEMADLRTELTGKMGALESRLLLRMNEQTRTLMLANVGMWLSVAGLMVGLRFT